MKFNDLKEASYAKAALSSLGDKLRGRPEGQLSIADRMAQQQFTQDFIGKLSSSLAQGISGGTVDPNPKSGAAGQASPTPAGKPAAPGAPASPAGSAPSPAGGAATPGAPAAPAGGAKTPEQVRKERQAAAAATANKQMADNPAPAKPAAPAAPNPAQAAAQKRMTGQQAATATAQKQMAANPAPAKPAPAPNPAQAAAATRQQKQAAATQALNKSAVPVNKVAQKPAVWKNNRNPSAPAKTSPTFESILDEAGKFPYTISSYVLNFVKQFMGNIDVNSLKPMADEVQATYAKDRGKKAFSKLASAAYSLYHTGGAGQDSEAPAGAAAPAGSKSSVGQSMIDALGGPASDASGTPASAATGAASSTASAPAGAPGASSAAAPTAQGDAAAAPGAAHTAKTVYKQLKDLLGKLNKQQKGFILNRLEKDLGVAAPAAKKAPAPAASDTKAQPTANFNQPMSYGKTTMNAPTGIPQPVNTSSRASKVSMKKKPAKQVAETKTYKLWGTGNASK